MVRIEGYSASRSLYNVINNKEMYYVALVIMVHVFAHEFSTSIDPSVDEPLNPTDLHMNSPNPFYRKYMDSVMGEL